jgi:HAE1 family hydrophobic/amphiphilic exporter-1
VLKRPVDTFVGVAGMLILTLVVPFQAVDCGGEDEGGLSDFSIRFTVPSAFTYSERVAVVEKLEKVVAEHKEEWGVRVYYARLRSSNTRGSMTVYLNDEGTIPKDQVLKQAKTMLPDLPGVEMTIGWSEQRDRQSGKVKIDLFGDQTEVLAVLSEEVERRMRGVEGVLGVHTDVETGGSEEVRLSVDQELAARVGLNATAVGRTVAFAMRGAPLPSWYRADREVQVYSRFRLEDRENVSRVLDFSMPSPVTGEAIPLSSLASSSIGKGWGSIRRRDGQTSLGITADMDPEIPPEEAYARVEASLGDMSFPPGYGRERGSEWKEHLEDQAAQQLALLLSVVFVFLIMGVLFESFALPLTVITTVPMAMLGVWWGLYFTGTGFDGMAAVGLIILIGIVVNNGIVLVDVITELRAQGMERDEALKKAVGIRLRPILMTALSATVGVLPMAVGDSTFVGIPYAPLGRVVASGMIVATVLTLFFIPYLYAVIDDMRQAQGRWLAYVLNRRA